ncbi:MAG: hypothetical protein WA821_00245 [Anaerolineales bacterium]
MPKKPDPVAGETLIAQYNDIARMTFQAEETDSHIASANTLSFGCAVAALVAYQFKIAPIMPAHENWVRCGFAVLFMYQAFAGMRTILQFAHLRPEWLKGRNAMNSIKKYYFANFKGLDAAFAWRNNSAPPKFEPESVGFMRIIQIAVVGGASFGLASFLAILAISGMYQPVPAFLAGVAFCFLQVWLYRHLLK